MSESNCLLWQLSVDRNKLELDRCILFPQAEGAVSAIESNEIDSRFAVEFSDLSFSLLSKLRLFRFSYYPKETGLNVMQNSFVKMPEEQLPTVIEVAIKSRKETTDKDLLRLIDRFIEKTKRSNIKGLTIWFNT